MPLDIDISTDYLLFDNLETVQYAVRTAESSYAPPVAVASAQREPEMYEQTTASNLLPKVTGYWNFWAAALTAASLGVPKVGDRFTDANGISWQVLSADVSRWLTGWRVLALKMR